MIGRTDPDEHPDSPANPTVGHCTRRSNNQSGPFPLRAVSLTLGHRRDALSAATGLHSADGSRRRPTRARAPAVPISALPPLLARYSTGRAADRSPCRVTSKWDNEPARRHRRPGHSCVVPVPVRSLGPGIEPHGSRPDRERQPRTPTPPQVRGAGAPPSAAGLQSHEQRIQSVQAKLTIRHLTRDVFAGQDPPRWGGWDSNPRPTDYEPFDDRPRSSRYFLILPVLTGQGSFSVLVSSALS